MISRTVEFRACTWTLNGKCYNYVTDVLDWNTAEAICSSAYGGHLVSKRLSVVQALEAKK
jgi:hypothetical protein